MIAPWIPNTPWTEPKFPVLATPWSNEYWVQYDPETEKFYDSDENGFTLEHLKPNVTQVVYGELGVFGKGRGEIIRRVIRKEMEVEDIQFRILEINLPDLIANSRAYQLVNLPSQPKGIEIPRVMQFANENDLNEFLAKWKDEGYAGMLVKPLDNMLYEAQHTISHPL